MMMMMMTMWCRGGEWGMGGNERCRMNVNGRGCLRRGDETGYCLWQREGIVMIR